MLRYILRVHFVQYAKPEEQLLTLMCRYDYKGCGAAGTLSIRRGDALVVLEADEDSPGSHWYVSNGIIVMVLSLQQSFLVFKGIAVVNVILVKKAGVRKLSLIVHHCNALH
jgi:hypothetical protein